MSAAPSTPIPDPEIPAPQKRAKTPARAEPTLSPAMKQYQQFKTQYPGYILFFRMGDFYEMFWEDAKTAAKTLGVALTSRNKGAADEIPMAGVPFHAVESYLRKMIAAGYKVAICEQMEDPAMAKGVIRRDVVRLMTPGTLTDEALLDGRSDSFLAAVAFHVTKADGYRAGLAWVELSTGECVAANGGEGQILDEIARLRPSEILVPELPSGRPHEIAGKIEALGIKAVTARPGWQFTQHHSREQIHRQWSVKTAGGFGFADDDPAVFAAAAVLSYLEETQKTGLAHIRPLRRHVVEDFLSIDPASWRSMEIDRTVRSNSAEGSLLSALDRTRTSMGARLLRQWLRCPLCDLEHIAARQSAVAALLESPAAMKSLVERLDDICDIERIIGRVAVGRCGPRDLSALGKCLASLPALLDQLQTLSNAKDIAPELERRREFAAAQAKYLSGAIKADPPPHLRDGGVIANAFDAELDRLRDIGTNSNEWLARYQARLAGESNIPSLRIGFNKVFGYYIEVTHLHREKAPATWTRKQTTTNSERYITDELKKFEEEALGAQDKATALEQQLFEKVRQALLPHVASFQDLAYGLARLDVLSSFAVLAAERRYCRPNIVDQRVLEIVDGRHPVLEQQLGSEFVSNDTRFSAEDSLALITGPNMAGKSTYIRQVALITLLAQIGCYVPAKSATVGLADRLFTRIGASDELHTGQSTFMVEMTETANILNNATDRSLVILDEIGRGTSTLDGLSLAWAIAEHVAANLRCRTLFATHYHELTDLAERYRGVKNLNVAVREWEDQVVFLHRIVEGFTDRSYGIHVARLAGVPKPVLDRARQLLSELAVHHVSHTRAMKNRKTANDNQLALFEDPGKELHKALAGTALDNLTPVQAFDLLRQWKEKWGQ
ncbi:MAG TPA: DNA mismatch repair protein MutS [Tepidisphaeraceae bacterium]|jgi:DNA mismatch repair protein MutS|nr:DNA mismatch repair protein MutS [Tepidisphaeraceae bacterium]